VTPGKELVIDGGGSNDPDDDAIELRWSVNDPDNNSGTGASEGAPLRKIGLL
jgi:hypothetical protein